MSNRLHIPNDSFKAFAKNDAPNQTVNGVPETAELRRVRHRKVRISSHPKQETRAEQKQRRRKEAEERNSVTARMAPNDRIKMLDLLFGEGVGAHKERARLSKLATK